MSAGYPARPPSKTGTPSRIRPGRHKTVHIGGTATLSAFQKNPNRITRVSYVQSQAEFAISAVTQRNQHPPIDPIPTLVTGVSGVSQGNSLGVSRLTDSRQGTF